MPGKKVLDSWALLCYLEREPGYQGVIDLFDDAARSSQQLLMCVINWGEVYYQVTRRLGERKARKIEALISSLPIRLVNVDQDLTREAARFKAAKRMAYADCFAAALAKRERAELYTGDPEFKAVEADVQVVWIGEPGA